MKSTTTHTRHRNGRTTTTCRTSRSNPTGTVERLTDKMVGLAQGAAAQVEVDILARCAIRRGVIPTRPGCARLLGILPLLAELVVLGALLLVGEHLIRLADLLEALFRALVPGVDIRVVLPSQLAIRLLDGMGVPLVVHLDLEAHLALGKFFCGYLHSGQSFF